MNERDNPDVIAYLEAENEYLEAAMKPQKKLQKKLFEEMKGKVDEKKLGDAKKALDNEDLLYAGKKTNAVWGLSASFSF